MKIIDDAKINPKGRLVYDIFEYNELIEHFDEDNVVVDGFIDVVANLVGNISGSPISQIGVGTSGTPALHVDTTLTNLAAKPIDSASKPATGYVQFNFTIGTGDFNGKLISEFGLLTTSSILCARRVRTTPLIKTASVSISGFWVLKI